MVMLYRLSRKTLARPDPSVDWVSPMATIVVVGAPRSGTSLLCALMEKTRQLGAPDEFFKHNLQKYPEIADPNDILLRLKFVAARATGGVCSFKLFPSQLRYAVDRVDLWRFFRNPIFVRVSRDDLLGQAISLVRAKQTNEWSSRRSGQGRAATYSFTQIEDEMKFILATNNEWDIYFARSQVTPMRVRYEEIVENRERVLSAIADRANVTLKFIPSLEESGLERQRDDLSDEWRWRYVADAKVAQPQSWIPRKLPRLANLASILR